MDELIQHQMELEQKFNKNQVIPRIKKEFIETEGLENYINEAGIPIQFGLDLMTHMALHKRAKIETMVGILLHHFNDAQMTADMILKCCEADLVDWSVQLKILVVKFTISQDVQTEIDKYQFPLPMVIEPREVNFNTDTGMLMSSGSIILKKNHHTDDVCLDHINRVNKMAFQINHDTAVMVKNQWRNLDKPKTGETKEDYQKRVKAFEKYDRTAHDVIKEIIHHGNRFHLTHKFDKRGRVYSQGYHINYQGNDWNKACLELADEEIIQ